MKAINRKIENQVIHADGRYLTDEEMRPLIQYASTYKNRAQTYYYLSQKSNDLVARALQRFRGTHPDIVETHGQKCRFDMTEVLRYIALSMLRDDEILFQEKILLWHCTMIQSHSAQAIVAYQHLKTVVDDTLSPEQAKLIHPYLDLLITSLQAYAF